MHTFIFSRTRLVLPFLLAASAAAQVQAPAGGEVTHLDALTITATPFRRNQGDLVQSTSVITGRPLMLRQQSSLGATIAGEPGMNATSFGPGSSRPIIRGLGGDRILVLENGTGTVDASVTSPDHAVSVEPLLVETIEIVRGPASLLYGSSALGGVVNVITNRIAMSPPDADTSGLVEGRYDTPSGQWTGGFRMDQVLNRHAGNASVLHVDWLRRSAGDLRIPSFAESEAVRAAEFEEALEHGEEPPVHSRGRLPNSRLDSSSASAGISLVGAAHHVGINFSGLDSRYGIPGHAHGGHGHEEEETEAEEGEHEDGDGGVRIHLRQRRGELQGEWRLAGGGILRAIQLKFGRAQYRHAEVGSDGEIGTLFTNRGHDTRIDLIHGGPERHSGAVGIQVSQSRFSASGEEAFLPPSVRDNAAVFTFQEFVQGPSTWQFGARLEHQVIDPAGAADRSDTLLGASAGVIRRLGGYTLAASIAQTGRAPNAQEQFAYGPHAGTQAFEIGDPAIGVEKSLGAEIVLRRREGAVTGAVSLFTNRFDGFIDEQATGQVAIEHDGEWEFLAPDDPEAEEAGGGLPVYRFTRSDARFWGAEAELVWHLHGVGTGDADVRVAADMVRATNAAGNLPRIPPSRIMAGVHWTGAIWTAGTDVQWVLSQRRTAPGEPHSAGHVLLDATLTARLPMGRGTGEWFIRGTNLLDEEVRPHTSFVRELAPLAGRGLTAGMRLSF